MDSGFGQMEVSGLAGQIGNLENRLLEEIMTTLSFGGERTVEFGIMFKSLTAEEFYVNMTLQINLFYIYMFVPHIHFKQHEVQGRKNKRAGFFFVFKADRGLQTKVW